MLLLAHKIGSVTEETVSASDETCHHTTLLILYYKITPFNCFFPKRDGSSGNGGFLSHSIPCIKPRTTKKSYSEREREKEREREEKKRRRKKTPTLNMLYAVIF